MRRLELNPVAIWLILMALTALSVRLAESGSIGSATIPIVFSFAALKSILVLISFMEIQRAKRHWRNLYTGWIAVVLAVLVIGCMW